MTNQEMNITIEMMKKAIAEAKDDADKQYGIAESLVKAMNLIIERQNEKAAVNAEAPAERKHAFRPDRIIDALNSGCVVSVEWEKIQSVTVYNRTTIHLFECQLKSNTIVSARILDSVDRNKIKVGDYVEYRSQLPYDADNTNGIVKECTDVFVYIESKSFIRNVSVNRDCFLSTWVITKHVPGRHNKFDPSMLVRGDTVVMMPVDPTKNDVSV
jgi:hypothetical protein